jgi:hypothetical protein
MKKLLLTMALGLLLVGAAGADVIVVLPTPPHHHHHRHHRHFRIYRDDRGVDHRRYD